MQRIIPLLPILTGFFIVVSTALIALCVRDQPELLQSVIPLTTILVLYRLGGRGKSS